jgi:Pyruvate/2-oxoacid:ferredoxin oxidoreductase delta subunit
VILYCNCSYNELVPPEAKRKVLEAVAASGERLAAVRDLCRLAADRDPDVKAWAETPNLTIVACYPRAVRWLFSYAGAPLPDSVRILNLRTAGPESAIEMLGLGAAGPAAAKLPPLQADGEWVPWFPVLDYERCSNCQQCLNFCVFGVYEQAPDGRVRVAQPRNCKNNCPACARLCPNAAVIFPKCPDTPINGAEPPASAAASPESGDGAPGEAELDALIAKRRARADAFRKARARKLPENEA